MLGTLIFLNFFVIVVGESWLMLYTLLLLGRGARGALGGARPLPLHHHGLLAAQDGAGSADGGRSQFRALLTLADRVPDVAERTRALLLVGVCT